MSVHQKINPTKKKDNSYAKRTPVGDAHTYVRKICCSFLCSGCCFFPSSGYYPISIRTWDWIFFNSDWFPVHVFRSPTCVLLWWWLNYSIIETCTWQILVQHIICTYTLFVCNVYIFKSWSFISKVDGWDNLICVDKRDGLFDFCLNYIIDRYEFRMSSQQYLSGGFIFLY